jgi:hypothetical protein
MIPSVSRGGWVGDEYVGSRAGLCLGLDRCLERCADVVTRLQLGRRSGGVRGSGGRRRNGGHGGQLGSRRNGRHGRRRRLGRRRWKRGRHAGKQAVRPRRDLARTCPAGNERRTCDDGVHAAAKIRIARRASVLRGRKKRRTRPDLQDRRARGIPRCRGNHAGVNAG